MIKIFNLFLVLAPILSVYYIAGGLDVATLLVGVMSPFILIWLHYHNQTKIRINYVTSVVSLYFIFVTFLNLIIGDFFVVEQSLILLRLLKFIFWFFFVGMFLETPVFNYAYIIKYYKRIGVICSLIVIFQQCMFFIFGYYISLVNYGDTSIGAAATRSFARPAGLFGEPSLHFQYIVFLIIYLLFSQKRITKENMCCLTIVLLGVLFSTSGQGIFVTLFLLGIKGFHKIKLKTLKIIFPLILLVLLLSQNAAVKDMVTLSMNRVTDFSSTNNTVVVRSGGYFALMEHPWQDFIFGYGYGNIVSSIVSESGFFPAMAYYTWCVGIGGVLLLIGSLFEHLRTPVFYKRFFLFIVLCDMCATLYSGMTFVWVWIHLMGSINEKNGTMLKRNQQKQ